MENNEPSLENRVSKLSTGQRALLDAIIDTFNQPVESWRNPDSNIVTADFLEAFGDVLKLHHTMSYDYLDKHRFEAAMERVYKALGKKVSRPGMCNPGHDLTVDDIPWSLKTQGDKSIRVELLHISKFMELGKGQWIDEKDLPGLRDRFLHHMRSYDRIFQLRYFRNRPNCSAHFYELVEIPKALFQQAENGQFEFMSKSTQNPKPGYCTVRDQLGTVSFKLYFDGGTERKLQIKELRKSLCTVHATWEF